ncbi:unnamed protein product [Caenorhabditis brenneri]
MGKHKARWARTPQGVFVKKQKKDEQSEANKKVMSGLVQQLERAKKEVPREAAKVIQRAKDILKASEKSTVDLSTDTSDEENYDVVEDTSTNSYHFLYPKKTWTQIIINRDKKKWSWNHLVKRYKLLKTPETAKVYLSRMRKELKKETNHLTHEDLDFLDRTVWEKVSKMDNTYEVIHDFMIKDIALKQAKKIKKKFRASATWIQMFKKRHNLVSRHIDCYVTEKKIEETQAMVFRDVSPAIRRRFPTMRHLISAGLLTEDEMIEFDAIVSPQSKYWQPIQWLFSLVTIAKDEGLIADYYLYVDLMDKMRDFRTKILNLVIFDMVPIPLVYTQVVNLAVRTYFLLALFGRQFLENSNNIPGAKWKIDIYFPVMTSLQIVFIIGWLKVSEVMLNPLGEDDEDFETNWIIERNLQVGYAVVDQAYGRFPVIKKDPFWEEETPQTMDTPTSTRKPHTHMQGSCINMCCFCLQSKKLGGADNVELARAYYERALKINPTDLRSQYGILLSNNQIAASTKNATEKKRAGLAAVDAIDNLVNRYQKISPKSNPESDGILNCLEAMKVTIGSK